MKCVFMSFFGVEFLRIQDDESLRRWKEQLLGSVDLNNVGGISLAITNFVGFLRNLVFIIFNSLSFPFTNCPFWSSHPKKNNNNNKLSILVITNDKIV